VSGMLVSVIIPVYNGDRYLGEAIESIIAQEHRPLEIIVVDDGSTDDTARVAEGFNQVRLIRQDHRGVGGARNNGVTEATGDSIAFLDADDIWADGKLAAQLAAFATDPGLDVAYAMVEEFVSPELDPESAARLEARPGLHPAPLPSTMIITRDALNRVGRFHEVADAGAALDWQLRVTDAGLKMTTVESAVVRRRVHDRNSGRLTRSQQQTEYLRAIRAAITRRHHHPESAS